MLTKPNLYLMLVIVLMPVIRPAFGYGTEKLSEQSRADLTEILEPIRVAGKFVFATGCTVRDDNYLNVGSHYVLSWVGNVADLVRFEDHEFYQVATAVWYPEHKSFLLEAQGGLWSKSSAQDIFDGMMKFEFAMITDISAQALVDLQSGRACAFEHPNLDLYTRK